MTAADLEPDDRVRFNHGPGYPDGTVTKIDQEEHDAEPFGVTWDDGVESWHSRTDLVYLGGPVLAPAPPEEADEFPIALYTQVQREMEVARHAGYSVQHDREHGTRHLLEEAEMRISRLRTAPASPSNAYPTDEDVRREIIVALGLLVNAYKVHDFAVNDDGHTVVL